MREIKFRIWNVYEEEMLDDVCCFTDDFTDMLNGFFDYYQNVVDDDEKLIFMQYTGLRDKNHKEIYEGDIVEIDTGAIGKVVFDEECAYFCIITKTGIFLFEDIPLEGIKVIGNIFENPELLEKLDEN